MRKMMSLVLVLILLSLGFSAVAAQDATPIELGAQVEGEITDAEYELEYTFEGSEGDIVLIQMFQAPNATDYVDAYLILNDPSGSPIAENDTDAAYYGQSTIAAELPESGEYTIIATRYSGRTGDSVGEFILQASIVTPLQAGDKIEAMIYGYDADERVLPNQYVVQGSGSVKLGFSQTVGDLFADVYLYPWVDGQSYPDSAFELTDTSKLSSAVFTVELEEGTLYILTVKDSFSSSVYDDSSVPVTITVG